MNRKNLIDAAEDLYAACVLAGPVIDSVLNGQGAVTREEMDRALLAINRAINRANGIF